jgi:hypothetical protein
LVAFRKVPLTDNLESDSLTWLSDYRIPSLLSLPQKIIIAILIVKSLILSDVIITLNQYFNYRNVITINNQKIEM